MNDVSEAVPFRLTRAFLATGLVTALVVSAAVSVVSAQGVRDDLLAEGVEFGVQIGRHINLQIHERFVLPTIARDGLINLDDPRQLRALDAVVRSSVVEFGIETVYLFDLEGRIQYSTNLKRRGVVVTGNPFYLAACKGEPASTFVERGSFLDVGGKSGGVPLLETYVPIYRINADGTSSDSLSGVIEIYQDAQELQGDVRSATLRVAATSTLGVVTLMLALWLWIRKAERTIVERTDALVAANERLASLSSDLEQQVEDRTRRLLRAETLATVGTLGAGVAHEVNNPVATIASCAEGLLRRMGSAPQLLKEPAFADFPEYLEMIRSEAFRVKAITQNLLDFSRQKRSSKAEAVDLGELLQATEQLVSHRLAEEEKLLRLELPDVPVVIQGDGVSLRQLLLNLTVNALDAAASEIRWTLAPEGAPESAGARLVCEDDGAGFDEEALQRALEPFYTQKPTGKGTGLGLSIAYGIAREHGGEIELGRALTGGARVVVQLSSLESGEART
jgi:two-component system, NtrC family, sensor kinase